MRVGYIRVSTSDQNTVRQETALADCEKLFVDHASGKDTKRPELQNMLSFIRQGDTVVVESFSRLARSLSDLLQLVEFMHKKGVEIVSLKENIDTTTTTGKVMLTLFGLLAEVERDQLLERQREGIQAAKRADAERVAQGLEPVKYRGRKPIATDPERFRQEYDRWKAGKQTAVETMKRVGLKRATFYKRVKDYEAQEGGSE